MGTAAQRQRGQGGRESFVPAADGKPPPGPGGTSNWVGRARATPRRRGDPQMAEKDWRPPPEIQRELSPPSPHSGRVAKETAPASVCMRGLACTHAYVFSLRPMTRPRSSGNASAQTSLSNPGLGTRGWPPWRKADSPIGWHSRNVRRAAPGFKAQGTERKAGGPLCWPLAVTGSWNTGPAARPLSKVLGAVPTGSRLVPSARPPTRSQKTPSKRPNHGHPVPDEPTSPPKTLFPPWPSAPCPLFLSFTYLFTYSFVFLGPCLWHVDVPRLGV